MGVGLHPFLNVPGQPVAVDEVVGGAERDEGVVAQPRAPKYREEEQRHDQQPRQMAQPSATPGPCRRPRPKANRSIRRVPASSSHPTLTIMAVAPCTAVYPIYSPVLYNSSIPPRATYAGMRPLRGFSQPPSLVNNRLGTARRQRVRLRSSDRGPICVKSMGWKPSFSAGDSGISR